MIFLQLPILVAMVIDLVMSILILIYSGDVFGYGWPDTDWCRRDYWRGGPNEPNAECLYTVKVARILLGVGGGLGFVIG
jgi:hypothetical protein